MTLVAILFLYLSFRAKQFVCDFLLQSDWMATNKGRPGWEGYRALGLHALVHGAGTLAVVLLFAPGFWWLAAVDVIIHGLIDRLKGMVTYQQGWNYTDKWFWWSFGLDQEAHNLTHFVYMLIILAKVGVLAGL